MTSGTAHNCRVETWTGAPGQITQCLDCSQFWRALEHGPLDIKWERISKEEAGVKTVNKDDPVKDFGKNMHRIAATMSPNYDQGKYLVQELLDDVYSRVTACRNLVDRIKKYPIDDAIPTLNPLCECQRVIEPALSKLEKRLTLLVLEVQILETKRTAAKLEEEFTRVQKAPFL